MGHITSKLFKLAKEYEDEALEQENTKPSTNDIPRTPIIEKSKPEPDQNALHESDPMKAKLLRTLKIDPRSPTVGIYRTPILVEDPNFEKPINCDSPVSVYSCNINDSLMQDVMTPIEPPANVSGFENTQLIADNSLEPEEIIEAERKIKNLKIVDKPNTLEARRLLDEIMSEEENFLKKVKVTKKSKRSEFRDEKKIIEVKSQLKSRIPLSNITSSANSPNQTIATGKIFAHNKIAPEMGYENSASPKVKHLAQWDQNNTVII